MVALGKRDIVTSIRYRLEKCLLGVSDLRYHSKQMAFYYVDERGATQFFNGDESDPKLDRISVKTPGKNLDLFLFDLFFAASSEEDNGTNFQFLSPLLARAGRLFSDFGKIFDFSGKISDLFHEKNVCVIQMANTNLDMQSVIPSLIGNIIFERMSNRKTSGVVPQMINLIVDEAHRILNEETSNAAVLATFEKIVKEGRKFGLFLMIASQRPSDISPTIISQLHNYFIHKLVNPQDIDRIRKAVAYMDEKALDLMTILAPGECIVSGTAFQMPSFIYVSRAEERNRPQSENVTLFEGKRALLKEKPLEVDSLTDDDNPEDE